jgi:hypothetical protein
MNRLELLAAFKENIIKFLDALLDLLPKEGDIIILRVMFDSQIPIEQAMRIFSARIIPYAEMVKNKDERFFIECTDLFNGIRKDKVSYFKDLWQSGNLTNADKESLWKWFRLFLYYAIQFEKCQ